MISLFPSHTEAIDSILCISSIKKYIYYSIPKNACTLIKAFLLQLEIDSASLPRSYAPTTDIHDLNGNVFRPSSSLGLREIYHALCDDGYTDLIALRDPRKRLRSAIKDKLLFHSPLRESIFYKAGLKYNEDLEISPDLLWELFSRQREIVCDPHFLPQYRIFSLIQRPDPVVLLVGCHSFNKALESFVCSMYGVKSSVDLFMGYHPWVLGHATAAKKIDDADVLVHNYIDAVLSEFYPHDLALWDCHTEKQRESSSGHP